LLEQAVLLPRKRISHAAKAGAKVAMKQSKEILRNSRHSYTMKFKDGNTWTKQDILRNLTTKLEKGKRKQKRVAQVTIRDHRVASYANFPEYGYDNPITGEHYEATHFMREGLTQTKRQVENTMIEDLRQSLDQIK
jgi:HK97 gp10 family phage protein